MTDPSTTVIEPFESKLATGRERFLAHAVHHSLSIGRRTADDFIRHFPPEVIMQSLADHPERRAAILVRTTGMKERIACKKSWQSAAEDLGIALTERETDAETIVATFRPDERVRFLEAPRLWAFVVEGDFWSTPSNSGPPYAIAKQHVAFLLERALTDALLSHADLVNGVSVGEIATRLPKAELRNIIEGALNSGRRRSPFTEVEFWLALTGAVLVEYVPLPHIWSNVVEPLIAQAHGYAPKSTTSTGRSQRDSDWVDVAQPPGSSDTEMVSEDDFA